MNKKILRTLTALCAALMLSGGFSVTAFAQTPEGEDDTNDSGVVYEEPQKEEPLTPDGNATLVDDFGGNKQLITVTTKNGNYFYILIDRDDEGENTVHFLNQVDEADLLALMEDGSTEAAPPAVCSCTEKCEAGKVNVSCPVCKDNMTACSGKEAEPETEEPPELPKEKGNAGGLSNLYPSFLPGTPHSSFPCCPCRERRRTSHFPDTACRSCSVCRNSSFCWNYICGGLRNLRRRK